MNIIASIGLIDITAAGIRRIIEAWAGDEVQGFDIEATASAYAEAAQAGLPESCRLYPAGVVVDAEVDDDLRAAIRAAFKEVDLAAIAVEV